MRDDDDSQFMELFRRYLTVFAFTMSLVTFTN